jgi:hypothetical protein
MDVLQLENELLVPTGQWKDPGLVWVMWSKVCKEEKHTKKWKHISPDWELRNNFLKLFLVHGTLTSLWSSEFQSIRYICHHQIFTNVAAETSHLYPRKDVTAVRDNDWYITCITAHNDDNFLQSVSIQLTLLQHGCFLTPRPENCSSLGNDGKEMSNEAISFQ